MRRREPAADGRKLDPRSLFTRLAGRRGLIVAVSGGPDSTALMALVAAWDERPPVLVVTVDHGLRPEAVGEARTVGESATRLELPFRIMRTPPRNESGNLQDWARTARYKCLVGAATDAGFDTIVTAHHLDDQAETFLLRLARGSGVYGLAAMPEEGDVDGLLLARPLLSVPREALRKIADASGLPAVSDPSNLDPRFDRVRMRALMPALAEHGLTAPRLTETAGRLRRAAAALEHATTELLRVSFTADRFGIVRGSTHALSQAPEEIALRALARIVRAVGGTRYTPPLDSVEALLEGTLAAIDGGKTKRTLSGAVISVAAGNLAAEREWGRAGPTGIPTVPGARLVWDGRFSVEVPPIDGELTIAPLGRSGRRLVAEGGRRTAIATLPGLYRHRELAAVPSGVTTADDGGSLARIEAECLVGQRLAIGSEGD